MFVIKIFIIFYGFCWFLIFVVNELGIWLENMLEIVWNVYVYVIDLVYLLKISFSIVFKINFVDNYNFIILINFLIFIFWFIFLLNICELLWIRKKKSIVFGRKVFDSI